MAFNSNAAVQNWRQLVEITLDSGVVRYAKDTHTLSDGTYYDGRLLSISTLRLSAGQLLDPRIVAPSLQLTLDNADGTMLTAIDSEEWGNRQVIIKVGQGATSGDYEEVFRGRILFPGGIGIDDQSVTIELNSERGADNVVIPANKFKTSTYANLEPKSDNLPIPIVYGDWLTTAGGGEKVPCHCVDTTAGTGGRFKIADHALKQIEAVYLNGSAITGNCTLDAANGEFTISSTSTYDPDVDVVTANVQGKTDDGLTSGNLLQSLSDIAQDVITDLMGLTSTEINAAQFTDWEGNLSTVDYGRRVLNTEVSSGDILTELLVEGFADMVVEDGEYYPVYRIATISGLETFRDYDIRDRSDGAKEFTITRDPERNYCNQIVATYRYDPANLTYRKRHDADNTSAQSSTGVTRRRRLTFKWLYETVGAENRAERELYAFSTETEVVNVALGPAALVKFPTNIFSLHYSKFAQDADTGTPIQIRDISADFDRMSATIRGWNVFNLSPGTWTADSATTWLLSTEAERNQNGYWTDASGYADTSGSPDTASQRSKWF